MSRVMSVRVSEECAAWAAAYAERAGVKRQVLLENAIESFRELCESGTPELRSFRDEESTESKPAAESPRRQQAKRVLAEVERGPHEPSVSEVFAARGRLDYARAALDRQARLNAAKYGGKS